MSMTVARTNPVSADPPSPVDALVRLESDVYMRVDGIAEQARTLAEQARAGSDPSSAARAELLATEADSRRGRLDVALAAQRRILATARAAGDAGIEARALRFSAATLFRLGMWADSLDAAGECVRTLPGRCPTFWRVEHRMILALYTSYGRAAGVDFTLWEQVRCEALELGDIPLALAVLNNFAWTAFQAPDGAERAFALRREMTAFAQRHRVAMPTPMLDTCGWLALKEGELAEAERWFTLGLSVDPVEVDDTAALLIHLGLVRRDQGRPVEAMALLERGRAGALAVGAPEFATEALSELAALDAARGDHRRAYRRMRRYVFEQEHFQKAESERRAALLQSVHATEAERDQRRYYQELSLRDPLTGLYIRRHLESELPALLSADELTLAMIDLDHFKAINDEHSHEAGDVILRELGGLLARHAESATAGFAVRLGGEEFVIVLPGLEPAAGMRALQQLRREIADRRFGPDLTVTISVGLVSAQPGDAASCADLLSRADALLYRAKREGRNRVVAG